MFSWLILVLLSLFSFIHPKWFYKSRLFLELYVLCEKSSDIASFAEYPVYNSLKMYSALILILIILFCRISPKVNVKKSCIVKILGAPRK